MQPKPAHLGEEWASQFGDPSVVAAKSSAAALSRGCLPGAGGPHPQATGGARYQLRRRRPCAAAGATGGAPGRRRSLRANDRARPHTPRRRPSAPALAARSRRGRRARPTLQPSHGGGEPAQDAWEVVLPRLRRFLVAGGLLAIVERRNVQPRQAAEVALIRRDGANQEFQTNDLADESRCRRLFRPLGVHRTRAISLRQPVGACVESMHARNGFSRERMAPEAAAAFDREPAALRAPFADGSEVRLEVGASSAGGYPALQACKRRRRLLGGSALNEGR